MILLFFALVALSWASWFISGMFSGKYRLPNFLASLALIVVVSGFIYWKLGSNYQLGQLMANHQQFKNLPIEQLAEAVTDKTMSLEDLFAELRLRNESEPNNPKLWLELGSIFLNSGQVDSAQQAFNRAANIFTQSDKTEQHTIRIQAARLYIDNGSNPALQKSKQQLNLVLLDNPDHEGALLLKGINALRLNEYQSAIEYWSRLLVKRNPESDSYKLIQQQINDAQQQLTLNENNHIIITIDKLDNIPLQRFTKAFVLIRANAGGPPLAVKTLALEALRKPITIGPNDTMLAGTDLWQATDIKVEVRLSQSGMATPTAGDVFGQTLPLETIKAGDNFRLSLTQTVK